MRSQGANWATSGWRSREVQLGFWSPLWLANTTASMALVAVSRRVSAVSVRRAPAAAAMARAEVSPASRARTSSDRHLRRMSLPAQTAAPRNLPTEARYGDEGPCYKSAVTGRAWGVNTSVASMAVPGFKPSTLLAVGLVVGLRREGGLNLTTNHLSFR